jgi:CheY-like chemotaxis protein
MKATTQILYIDDDSDDCVMLSESLTAVSSTVHLDCLYDGEEAFRYLHTVPSSELPDLIILDLNMPRWDGKTTLSQLKSDPLLSGIPVVILSTSENMADKEYCTRLGAASYLQKPYHYTGYTEIIRNFMPLITD